MGMPWFQAEHYDRLRKMFTDEHVLPRDYETWLKRSTELFEHRVQNGYSVERVYIDPIQFPKWCEERMVDMNTRSRIEFVNWTMLQKYK
jgi:hypothetical protein